MEGDDDPEILDEIEKKRDEIVETFVEAGLNMKHD